jgi:hypothetical protein
MNKIIAAIAVAFSLACLTPAAKVMAAEDGPNMLNAHRLGLGVNYWKTIDNIGDNFDNHGFSYIGTYQYVPVWFFKVEADLEVFPDPAGTGKPFFAPELFLTVGGLIYGGVGIGIYNQDSNWGDKPFYMLRAGLDIPILPRLFLDINANYRFDDFDSFDWKTADPGTDTIRLGAALRFTL